MEGRGGVGSVKTVSGCPTGQPTNKQKIHVMNSSTASVRWCVEVVASVFRQIWHVQVCATEGAIATRIAL